LIGGTPANTAAWTTLFDAITAAEKVIYGTDQQITEALGYAAGSEVPVATKTYALTGTGGWTAPHLPGDCAALVRYATAVRTSKNHPLYLFNYYKGIYTRGTGHEDEINTGQVTAIQNYANAWIGAGFSDGTSSYKRGGPNGASATGALLEQYVTHRDFPR
jgi:hypothetical protein